MNSPNNVTIVEQYLYSTTHHRTLWVNNDNNLGENNYYNVINLYTHSHTS